VTRSAIIKTGKPETNQNTHTLKINVYDKCKANENFKRTMAGFVYAPLSGYDIKMDGMTSGRGKCVKTHQTICGKTNTT